MHQCVTTAQPGLPLQWGAPAQRTWLVPGAALEGARPAAAPGTGRSPERGRGWRRVASWGTGSTRGRRCQIFRSLASEPPATAGESAGRTASCTRPASQPGRPRQIGRRWRTVGGEGHKMLCDTKWTYINQWITIRVQSMCLKLFLMWKKYMIKSK